MTMINVNYVYNVNGILNGKRKMGTYNVIGTMPMDIPDISLDDTKLVALDITDSMAYHNVQTYITEFRKHDDDLYTPVINSFIYDASEHKVFMKDVTMAESSLNPDEESMFQHLCEHVHPDTKPLALNRYYREEDSPIILSHDEDYNLLEYTDIDDFKHIESSNQSACERQTQNKSHNFIMIDGVLYEKSRGIYADKFNNISLTSYSYDVISDRNFRRREVSLQKKHPVLLSFLDQKSHLDNMVKSQPNLSGLRFTGYYIDDIDFFDKIMKRDYGRILIESMFHTPIKESLSRTTMPVSVKINELRLQEQRILDQYGFRDIIQQCIDNDYDMDYVRMAVEQYLQTEFSNEPGKYLGDREGRSNIKSDSNIFINTKSLLKRFLTGIDEANKPDVPRLNFYTPKIPSHPFKIPTLQHEPVMLNKL